MINPTGKKWTLKLNESHKYVHSDKKKCVIPGVQHCPNLIHALDIGQHLWEESKSSFRTSPGKRCRPSLVKTLWSVLYLIHFLYSWPETLHSTLIQTNFLTLPPPPPSNPIFKNSLHRQLRWSGNARLLSQSNKLPHPPPQPGIWKLSIPVTYFN